LRNFVKGFKIVNSIARPVNKFYYHSKVLLSKNDKSKSISKCIDIKHISVRKIIKRHEVSIEYISTKLIIVDHMIKSLPVKQYKSFVAHLKLTNSFCIVFLLVYRHKVIVIKFFMHMYCFYLLGYIKLDSND
jgi:hypothetical protein